MNEDQMFLEFRESYGRYQDLKKARGLGLMRIPDEVVEKYAALKGLGISRRVLFEKTGLTESSVSSLNKRVADQGKLQSKNKFKSVKVVLPAASSVKESSTSFRFTTTRGIDLVVQDFEVALRLLQRL